MSADLVHIPVGGSSAIRRRTAEFDRAVSASFYRRVGIWRGYLLTPSGSGLASARLASAQAMARLLSDRGWGASVYYQRD